MNSQKQKALRSDVIFNSKILIAGLLAAGLATAAEPAAYGLGFIASPATGVAMNNRGLVTGVRHTLPPGCTPSTCLGVTETVVWAGRTAIPLPRLAGFSTVTAVSINNNGWVAGYAGDPTSTGGRAVVWKPTGNTYTAIDLGVLPGTTSSAAAGIDDSGRVVGYSTTLTFPPAGAPFVWTETGGMTNLSVQGFPNETPLAISPGGAVATPGYWYRLGNPASVTQIASPPSGFSGPGNYPAAINDSGDQVRFQLSTSSQFLPYLFRYNHNGTWQQIWSSPGGSMAPLGIGSINSAGDITATVNGVGLVAYGPAGPGKALATKLSPAYGGGSTADPTLVPTGGPITNSGQILARVMIGRSPRLVRLGAKSPCTSGCTSVASIQMTGRMIGSPPGQCTPTAFNYVTATATVADEFGSALPGATVNGRFLDDYYLNKPVTAVTSGQGSVVFINKGLACVGAVAFLVDGVTMPGRVLDYTHGELSDSVIPQP